MTHFTRELAARWVAGVLEDDDAQLVEDHARRCGTCQTMLASEARAEVALTHALTQLPRARPARLNRVIAVAVPLALAASLLLVALGSHGVIAHTSDGGIATSVPRYELDDEVPREAFSALEPAGL